MGYYYMNDQEIDAIIHGMAYSVNRLVIFYNKDK